MFMSQQELSKKSDENLKVKDFLIHLNVLTMISITLFYCCKKAFTLMEI